MIAYKFLKRGRVAPFTGCVWPEPGGWMNANGVLSVCSQGIHACRVSDVPYWIDEELWQIELGGNIVEDDVKLVADRGRLIEQVSAWQDSTWRAFADHCLQRVVHHAAGELSHAGFDAEATSLQRAASTSDLLALRGAAGRASVVAEGGRSARRAGHLAGYVLDAIDCLDQNDPAGAAYVAAHTADSRSTPDADGDQDEQADPFIREREIQAEWLREQLELRAS